MVGDASEKLCVWLKKNANGQKIADVMNYYYDCDEQTITCVTNEFMRLYANTLITSIDLLDDLVKNEAFNEYQRMQIDRIRKAAFEEGRLMEFRIQNSILRNLDNSDNE